MNSVPDQRIAVVTDSCAFLPPELVEAHGIHVVPVYLTMGEKTWRDGVEIQPPEFYELLKTSPDFPITSQPTPADFRELFVELAKEVEGIVAVLVSEKLSGTVNSANLAAADLPDIPIKVVDSLGASMLQGFPVLEAARAAAAGADIDAVVDAAHKAIDKTHIYFVVGTLEYLHRGGRIGTAVKYVGSALNLKPILEFQEGVIESAAMVRTRRRAWEKIYSLLDEQLSEGDKVHMGVLNVAAPEEAARFRDQLVSRFRPVEVIEVECSPAIGSHAGPGTVGVAFYVE